MAKRTFLRNPQGVDVGDYSDYEESLNYFNFSQFNGINSNKNYVSIDQSSFEEVENVYVDQDGQLHTRPPLKEYLVLPLSYHVLQIFKVNNLTIYHVQDGTSYKLVWKYDNILVETVDGWVYDKVKIINKNGLYIVFTQDSSNGTVDLKGFELYEGEWQYYTANDIIYVPEAEVIRDNVVESGENRNFLTESFYSTVIFNSDTTLSISSIVGKFVTITIKDNDNETFVLETNFVSGLEKVLTKKVNTTTINADIVDVKRVLDSDVLVYLMYSHSENCCYLSIGGTEFYTITYPSENSKCPILSDDGTQLFILDTTISGSFDNGVNNTSKSLLLYYINIQSDTDSIKISSWTELEFDDDTLSVNCALTTVSSQTPYQYNAKYELYRLYHTESNSYAFGHSPEYGRCVYMIPARVHANVYVNEQAGFSLTGSRYDAYADVYYCIIYNNDVIHTYYIMNMLPEDLGAYSKLYHFTTARGISNRVRLVPSNRGYPLLILWTPKLEGTTLNEWITDNDYGYFGSYLFLNDNYEFVVSSVSLITWGSKYLINPTQLVTNAAPYLPIVSYCVPLDTSQTTLDFQYSSLDLSYYEVDIANVSFSQAVQKFICNTILLSTGRRNSITSLEFDYYSLGDFKGSEADYVLQYTYNDWTYAGVVLSNSSRSRNRFSVTRDIDEDFTLSNSGEHNLNYHRFYSTTRYLTDVALIENSEINYIRPSNKSNIWPVYIDKDYIVYYDKQGMTLYSSSDVSDATIKYLNSGATKLFMPNIVKNFITIALSKNNVLYWTTDVLNEVDINGEKHQISALYIEQINDTKGNWQNLPDDITELTVFSQTSLGVFLENNVYEFQYNVDNDVYLLTPTKLQLGNKKGSEVLANYDGQSIFITNIKGLISLTYEDFVQSTEQVYNYLTENIMSEYDKFANAPIKLYQYKDWLFMYKENATELYVYDTRNKSWWYWTHPYGIKQIVFDGNQVIVLTTNYLLYYDFETTDFKDLTDTVIPWKIVSQKIHFAAPNNYKHIRQIAIITTQNTETMRYKLAFINYHNLYNLVDTDTVEYEISQLTTMIKRVTFMKTNAFQFIIKSDDTDKYPKYFATPNIAIKYRITERVR